MFKNISFSLVSLEFNHFGPTFFAWNSYNLTLIDLRFFFVFQKLLVVLCTHIYKYINLAQTCLQIFLLVEKNIYFF